MSTGTNPHSAATPGTAGTAAGTAVATGGTADASARTAAAPAAGDPQTPGSSRKRLLESTFPPLLFLAGLLGLGYGLWAYEGAFRLVVALYLVWVLLELKVTFRPDPGETGGADESSMPLYGMARGLVVAAALFVPPATENWSPAHTVASVVFVAGVVLRLTAIWQLGRFYSHKVRTLSDHRIVQSGPYRLVRHPAYSGMVLAHLGFTAVFLNPASAIVTLLMLIPAVVHRIRVEERTLLQLPGYAAFAEGRKRLLPLVW